MKGIILAGGSGTRLHPITIAVSKQLLLVYDKPMIYYPISTLMLAGIRDILIISTPYDLPLYKKLLNNGNQFGLNLSYKEQPYPGGIAQAFLIGKDFIGDDNVALILGDNIFYGQHLSTNLNHAIKYNDGATVFGYYMKNPQQFGVIEFDKDKNVISIEEKPNKPKSNYIIPGLYFYDNNVVEITKKLKPSKRGELEITDLNNIYLENGMLKVELFGRGMAWFDTGTFQGLLEASNFIHAIQQRQGFYISCLEEIAYRKGFISIEQLKEAGEKLKNSDYGKYLLSIYREET